MTLPKYRFHVDVDFTETCKPYSGPDPDLKYPGEDDPIWCERCKCNHRRGAGWEIERERAIRKAAQKIAEKIDAEFLK